VPPSNPDSDSGIRYEQLVAENADRLWRLAYRLTGDRQEAEDLTQETFYEAWRSLRSLRHPAAARAWLASILLHRASRWLRRRRTHRPITRTLDESVDVSPLRGPELETLARQELLQRALDALDPDRRVAFLMVFQEGNSCREAAERLGIPLGTLLSRVHRARGELRWHLRQVQVEGQERHGGDVRSGGGA
jgi:RNA polymerase sigma-70 factor, ECF subfamily